MKFSLQNVFTVVAIFACFAFWLSVKQNDKIVSISGMYAPKNVTYVKHVNQHEGLVFVGQGTKLKISLIKVHSDVEVELGNEFLEPGRHFVRIYWGAPEVVFGFYANGNVHTVPFKQGTSKNSIDANLRIGESSHLAGSSYLKDNVSYRVKLSLEASQP